MLLNSAGEKGSVRLNRCYFYWRRDFLGSFEANPHEFRNSHRRISRFWSDYFMLIQRTRTGKSTGSSLFSEEGLSNRKKFYVLGIKKHSHQLFLQAIFFGLCNPAQHFLPKWQQGSQGSHPPTISEFFSSLHWYKSTICWHQVLR